MAVEYTRTTAEKTRMEGKARKKEARNAVVRKKEKKRKKRGTQQCEKKKRKERSEKQWEREKEKERSEERNSDIFYPLSRTLSLIIPTLVFLRKYRIASKKDLLRSRSFLDTLTVAFLAACPNPFQANKKQKRWRGIQ